jgi:ferredoxin
MLRIEVDETRCDGFGLCQQAAPEVVELDEDGFVSVVLAEVPGELAAKAEAAVRSCPVGALRISR